MYLMRFPAIFLLSMVTILLSSCSKLSPEAEKIIGTYYNTELSQSAPVMELREDASCTIRAIKPGVLTYCVEGTWNVENDTIFFELEPSTLRAEGDKSLIGVVPSRFSRHVVDYNDFILQLEHEGVVYQYLRRSN